MFRRLLQLVLVGALFPAGLARADDDVTSRVIVLANSRSAESIALATFYVVQRGVPAANVIALPMPEAETITWRQFVDEIHRPLQDSLVQRGLIEGVSSSLVDRVGRRRYAFTSQKISYLVVCRGVPLRIGNDASLLAGGPRIPDPFQRNDAAVDSELSLLATANAESTGYLSNPLFQREAPAVPPEAALTLKVSRLDGPDWTSARQLVTSAIAAEKNGLRGRYYVDLGGPHREGDDWLRATRAELTRLGFDGEVEETPALFDANKALESPLFYFGWYTGDCTGALARSDFHFLPGAIALHIHSFSAQTLHSSTVSWCGPLIAHGVTATVGNVFEPYLQLTHRPDLLMHALAQGKRWGDAVYYSIPVLSWQGVAIGDPLYQPFKRMQGKPVK